MLSSDVCHFRYTREAGVRSLERKIGAICRAVAVKVAEGHTVAQIDASAPEGPTQLGGKKLGLTGDSQSQRESHHRYQYCSCLNSFFDHLCMLYNCVYVLSFTCGLQCKYCVYLMMQLQKLLL